MKILPRFTMFTWICGASQFFIVKTPEGVEYRRNRQEMLKPNMTNEPNEAEIKRQPANQV